MSPSGFLGSLRQPKLVVRVRAGRCSLPVLGGGEGQEVQVLGTAPHKYGRGRREPRRGGIARSAVWGPECIHVAANGAKLCKRPCQNVHRRYAKIGKHARLPTPHTFDSTADCILQSFLQCSPTTLLVLKVKAVVCVWLGASRISCGTCPHKTTPTLFDTNTNVGPGSVAFSARRGFLQDCMVYGFVGGFNRRATQSSQPENP